MDVHDIRSNSPTDQPVKAGTGTAPQGAAHPPPAPYPPATPTYPPPASPYGGPPGYAPPPVAPPAGPYGPPPAVPYGAPAAPPYGAPPAPGYGPGPGPGRYGTAPPGIDPRFAHITTEYGKRNYKVVSATPGTITMERPSTKLNWFAVIGLTILFGVTVLLYLVPWFIWGIHRTYRVTLSIGPSGEVEEFGDVLASYDRDRLVAHRIRCLGTGITAAVAGALMAIGGVGASLSSDTGAADRIPTLIVSLVVALILGGGAYLLFRTARNTKRKIDSAPAARTPAAVPAAPPPVSVAPVPAFRPEPEQPVQPASAADLEQREQPAGPARPDRP